MCRVWFNYCEVRLNVTTSQSVSEEQGNTRTEDRIDRQKNIIGQSGRTSGIETPHPTGLRFSRIRTQSIFNRIINLINLSHLLHQPMS